MEAAAEGYRYPISDIRYSMSFAMAVDIALTTVAADFSQEPQTQAHRTSVIGLRLSVALARY
jgi:hypothetical protein